MHKIIHRWLPNARGHTIDSVGGTCQGSANRGFQDPYEHSLINILMPKLTVAVISSTI